MLNTKFSSHFWERPVAPTPGVDVKAMPVFRRGNFPVDGGPAPWLDLPDAEARIAERVAAGEISVDEAELCRKWSRDGYLVLAGFYTRELMDQTWGEYEAAIASGRANPPPHPIYFPGDPLPGRLQNVHTIVPAMDRMLHEPRINRVISMLLGAKAQPFQTIVGHKATDQKAHSDSIHVTTYPTGYLAATWLAFEDIDPNSGPLVYYPGSQKLPYVLSEELGMASAVGDYTGYLERYEPAIQSQIADHQLRPEYFHAKKGDLLIWHANLLHGGSPRRDHKLSRKALVCHYIAEGVVSYHDIFGTLSYVQLGLSLYPPQLSLPPPVQGILRRVLGKIRRSVGV